MQIVENDSSDISEGRELMYSMGQSIFGDMALRMLDLGWSVYPQERGERRMPATVDDRPIKWGNYVEVRPSRIEVARWALQVPTHNVAVAFGPASGNTFGFDIDVTDEFRAWEIRELAKKILGETPLQRVGRYPKILLIYRYEEGSEIPNRSFRFEKEVDGVLEKSDDQIEILGVKKTATFFGIHHKTGGYFQWPEKNPQFIGPESCPIVSEEKVALFLEEVNQKYKFYDTPSLVAEVSDWVKDDSSGVVAPRVKSVEGASLWKENDAGIVVDGRERFLWEVVRLIVKGNHLLIEKRDGIDKIKSKVLETFQQKAEISGRWKNPNLIREEINEKVNRAVSLLKEGVIKPLNIHNGKQKEKEKRGQAPEREVVEGLDSLDFLPKRGRILSSLIRKDVPAEFISNNGKYKEERKLYSDRKEISENVQNEIKVALDTFFEEVYDFWKPEKKRIHVLRAPTGAGKTTRTIKYIAEDERTKKYQESGPILFLLPTYANIEELRVRAKILNLDGRLSDSELAESAAEMGLIQEDEMESRLADLRRDAMDAGLKTMIYKGKIAAGCMMKAKMELLMSAGISTSGLCRTETKTKDGEKEIKECEYYHSCPAIMQKKEIRNNHVVFLAHAFFTLNVPDEMKKVRAVIADERIFHLFLHTTTMSLTTLRLPRKTPKLMKKEKEGLSHDDAKTLAMDLVEARNDAADLVLSVFAKNENADCPANVLKNYVMINAKGEKRTGLDLVKAALRVCGGSMLSGEKITPDTSFEDLEKLCKTPTGAQIREEYRFWKIMEDRINAMNDDEGVNAELKKNAGLKIEKKAKGKREYRIQFIKEDAGKAEGIKQELIRLSWRSEPNWAESNLLLLDASASSDIIGKIFGNREVMSHNIDASLNIRTVAVIDKTYSNVSMVAASPKVKKDAAIYAGKQKDMIRKAISNICAMYGWGRVVIGSSVVVRKALNTAWVSPPNADWTHFGAMRGLDFAKSHGCAISIGRMEVPTRSIDGIVAALSYDDAEPEEPFDKNGDGRDSKGNDLKVPLVDQKLKMRSGDDAVVSVPIYPGKWAKIVQQQYREEELRQFLGRLRPVYRSGEAPIWFAISRIVPEDVIVDDVINLNDLTIKGVKKIRIFDAARQCNGIIHADLIYHAARYLYKNREEVVLEMKSFGFEDDKKGGGLDKRATWGFRPCRINGPDQKITYAYIYSEHRHVEEILKKELTEKLEWNADDIDIEVNEPVREVVVGSKRKFDWVDEEIGKTEERKSEELKFVDDVMEQALWRCAPEIFAKKVGGNVKSLATPLMFPLSNDDECDKILVSVDEASAVLSNEFIVKKMAAKQIKEVISPSEDYSNYSYSINDDDMIEAGQENERL